MREFEVGVWVLGKIRGLEVSGFEFCISARVWGFEMNLILILDIIPDLIQIFDMPPNLIQILDNHPGTIPNPGYTSQP